MPPAQEHPFLGGKPRRAWTAADLARSLAGRTCSTLRSILHRYGANSFRPEASWGAFPVGAPVGPADVALDRARDNRFRSRGPTRFGASRGEPCSVPSGPTPQMRGAELIRDSARITSRSQAGSPSGVPGGGPHPSAVRPRGRAGVGDGDSRITRWVGYASEIPSCWKRRRIECRRSFST